MILAGDIGGTKTLVSWFELRDGTLAPRATRSYPSQQFSSLEAVLDRFLAEAPGQPHAACFGIAGPIVAQRSRLTNLGWDIDAQALRAHLATPRVQLLNDLESIGHSLDFLRDDELLVLQAGAPRVGNRAIIAAGTGLGECIVLWDHLRHIPTATEGGHADFAARTPWEAGLQVFLEARYGGHVSYERVLSGQGFVDLFDYLVTRGARPTDALVQARQTLEDPAPAISEAGRTGSCPVCSEVMARLLSIYGAEAGNLALKSLALGGVYVGGGIAPRLRERMQQGEFMEGFLAKGRFRGLLEEIPVRIILNPEAGLLGAASFASQLLRAAAPG